MTDMDVIEIKAFVPARQPHRREPCRDHGATRFIFL